MKKQILNTHTLAACSLALASVMLSCSSEADELNVVSSEPEEMTEEMLEKIAYGCDSYLYDNPTDEKVETSASDEYMALIEQRLSEYGGNKYVEYDFDGTRKYVGVIKADAIRGCGKYDEVEIHYDCENTGNQTNGYGFIGEWKAPGNITMKFCLVPYSSFRHTGEWYGVMNFSDMSKKTDLSTSVSNQGILECYMDAEDHHDDKTYMRVYTSYGTFPAKMDEWKDKYRIGQVEIPSNGNLKFQMIVFEPTSGYYKYSYPDFGFDYGLFGTLKPHVFTYDATILKKEDGYGMVHSDDEDKNNANSIKYNEVSKKNQNFNNIIQVTANTNFYISRVNTYK